MCSKGGTTTTTQKSDPWVGVQSYLNGYGGIYPEAQSLYQRSGFTPDMQKAVDDQVGVLSGRSSQDFYDQSKRLLGTSPVGNIAGYTEDFFRKNYSPVDSNAFLSGLTPDSATSKNVDPMSAFRSLGAADPTSALSKSLSGAVDTSTLNPVINNTMRRMGENFNEQVLPGIRGGAVAAGQYGGSRQGIAEGLASKGLSYSMGDAAASLTDSAYRDAQNRMTSTANSLAPLALSNEQQNAGRDLNASMFNAGQANDMKSLKASLGLQSAQSDAARYQDLLKFGVDSNNQVRMFNANLGLNNNSQLRDNIITAMGLRTAGDASADNSFAQKMGLFGAPSAYDWNNLKNYASIIQPGSGIGGTSTTENPYYVNKGANALGGALSGAQLASLLGVGSGWGAGLGALAMLSDRRMKTDIQQVGSLNNGLPVYRYRYKAGGPMTIGVMADEVKQSNPDAVINVGGVDYVKYGDL